MKFKSIPITLTILLFIIGITQFMMLFMKFKIPTILASISVILFFTIIISSSIKALKLKLAYPIIIIFYFVGMPIIESFIVNKSLYMGFAILSFIIVLAFIYKDLVLTSKKKKLVRQ